MVLCQKPKRVLDVAFIKSLLYGLLYSTVAGRHSVVNKTLTFLLRSVVMFLGLDRCVQYKNVMIYVKIPSFINIHTETSYSSC